MACVLRDLRGEKVFCFSFFGNPKKDGEIQVMANFAAYAAYFMTLVLDGAVLLLTAQGLLHIVPSWRLNPVRRFLFGILRPLLRWETAYYPLRWGPFRGTGLVTAILLFVVSRYGIPWMVLLSFSSRG